MNINPQCIRKEVDYELINQAQDLIKEQKNLGYLYIKVPKATSDLKVA